MGNDNRNRKWQTVGHKQRAENKGQYMPSDKKGHKGFLRYINKNLHHITVSDHHDIYITYMLSFSLIEQNYNVTRVNSYSVIHNFI